MATTREQDQATDEATAGAWAQLQGLTSWYGPNRSDWVDAITQSINQVVT